MYDICDIKLICHIAYLVSIFFFYFQELKKSERHVLPEDFNEDRIVFVCFVCASEELTGEGEERRLLLRKEGNECSKL